MKPFHPTNLYITEWAADDPRCVARMERLVAGFGRSVDEVRVVCPEDIEPLVRERNWADLDIRQGRVSFKCDPDVVFNRLRWTDADQNAWLRERYPLIRDTGGYTNQVMRMLYGGQSFTTWRAGWASASATSAASRCMTCTPPWGASINASIAGAVASPPWR